MHTKPKVLMINTVKYIGIIVIVNCLVFALNSCNVRKCYYSKFIGEHGDSVLYTLSLYGDRYTFEKQEYPNFYADFSGFLLKRGLSELELIDDFNADSIEYPFTFVNDKEIANGFVLKIPINIIMDGKIFLNDTVFFNEKFSKWTILVDTTININKRPKRVQIYSKPFNDMLFRKYKIKPQSVVYLIPDTCNTLVIKNVPLDSLFMGVDNLVFNKRHHTLCVDTNCIQFKRCR